MPSSFLLFAVLLSAANELRADERCCPGIGCFGRVAPFLQFPLPDCCEQMGISTKVYTRENKVDGQDITNDTIPPCFKGGKQTVFIVHGWAQNENFPWMQEMKNAFLEQGDYNVIIVGWRIGASYYFYPRSASNTRTVGAAIALIVSNLIKNGYSSKALTHCVGHSLGAHICGQAGNKGQIARISGLDPAGPLFDDPDVTVGLNPSCADFVDVIHTNGLIGLGLLRTVGHVDFYPNGGQAQPGCTGDSVAELLKWKDYLSWTPDQQDASLDAIVACSHMRACDYFTESIRTRAFVARNRCATPAVVNDVVCPKVLPNAIQIMGFYANKNAGQGIYYLKTNAASPYSSG